MPYLDFLNSFPKHLCQITTHVRSYTRICRNHSQSQTRCCEESFTSGQDILIKHCLHLFYCPIVLQINTNIYKLIKHERYSGSESIHCRTIRFMRNSDVCISRQGSSVWGVWKQVVHYSLCLFRHYGCATYIYIYIYILMLGSYQAKLQCVKCLCMRLLQR